jgi:hypothetical protein
MKTVLLASFLLLLLPVNKSPRHYVNGDQPSPAQTPFQVYQAYRAAFEHAQDFTPLRPYLAASVLAQIEAAPLPNHPRLFAMAKEAAAVWQVTLVTDTALSTGDHVLAVQGVDSKDRPLVGSVELRLETDAWKIVRETWRHPQ